MQGSPRCQTPTGALRWAQRATPMSPGPSAHGSGAACWRATGCRVFGKQGAKSGSPGPTTSSCGGASSPLTAPTQGCSQGYEAHGPCCGQLGSSLPASLGTGHCVMPCTALATMKCAVCLSARSGCRSIWTELRYRLTPNIRLNQVPLPVGAQCWGLAADRGCQPVLGGHAKQGMVQKMGA